MRAIPGASDLRCSVGQRQRAGGEASWKLALHCAVESVLRFLIHLPVLQRFASAISSLILDGKTSGLSSKKIGPKRNSGRDWLAPFLTPKRIRTVWRKSPSSCP
jgi:hypothetical protein